MCHLSIKSSQFCATIILNFCVGTPRLARPKKDTNGNSNIRTNRFGFRGGTPLSNKVADSHANNDTAHYMYTPDACHVDSSKPTLKVIHSLISCSLS